MKDLSKESLALISEKRGINLIFVFVSDESFVHSIGQRAIGVIYKPEHERFGNYVPTVLSQRYDSLIFINKTGALRPISPDSGVCEELELIVENIQSPATY